MFKMLFKLIIAVILLAVFTLIGTSIYYTVSGKKIVEDSLSEFFKRKVTVERFIVQFPLSIHAENIGSGNIKVDSIDITLNPVYFLKKEFVIENAVIRKPEFTVKRDAAGLYVDDILVMAAPPKPAPIEIPVESSGVPAEVSTDVAANVPVEVPAVLPVDPGEERKIVINQPDETLKVIAGPIAASPETPATASAAVDFVVRIKQVKIEDGIIVFTDAVQETPFIMTLSDIAITLKDIDADFERDTAISAQSSVKYLDTVVPKALSIDGKVNLRTKDIKMKVLIDGLEYSYFKNYYPSSWRPDKLNIEKATLRLDSDIFTEQDKLIMKSALSLKDLKFAQTEDSEKYAKVAQMITSIVSAFKGEKQEYPTFEFKVSTDLNNPNFNLDEIYRQFRSKARIPMNPAVRVVSIIDKGVRGAGSVLKTITGKLTGFANSVKK